VNISLAGRGAGDGVRGSLRFADVLQLPRDVCYGVYIAAVLVFFVLWARATGQRLAVMVRRRWRLAVGRRPRPGFALLLGLVVVGTEPSTTGPQGLALAWALLWRGVAYGAADGLLLSGEQHHGRHEHQQVDQAAPHRPLPNDQGKGRGRGPAPPTARGKQLRCVFRRGTATCAVCRANDGVIRIDG
jgi:hypothetical protein